ncbi:MAG: acyl carrier protein [Anaerolineae bacterium]|nr:acyl carrier protein [Anaerolineae bacterium]
MEIQTQIREYVAKNLLFSGDGFKYSDDASFLEEGIVDSMGVLELVMFIEETFGVSADDQEIIPDNFDSVNKLANYVAGKMAVSGPIAG